MDGWMDDESIVNERNGWKCERSMKRFNLNKVTNCKTKLRQDTNLIARVYYILYNASNKQTITIDYKLDAK